VTQEELLFLPFLPPSLLLDHLVVEVVNIEIGFGINIFSSRVPFSPPCKERIGSGCRRSFLLLCHFFFFPSLLLMREISDTEDVGILNRVEMVRMPCTLFSPPFSILFSSDLRRRVAVGMEKVGDCGALSFLPFFSLTFSESDGGVCQRMKPRNCALPFPSFFFSFSLPGR